jgi:rRNA maturation protein Nop10
MESSRRLTAITHECTHCGWTSSRYGLDFDRCPECGGRITNTVTFVFDRRRTLRAIAE